MVAVEEGIGEGDRLNAADSGFHCATDGAGAEGEDGRAVAPIVGARDDEVDGAAGREVVVEADLYARGGCGIDQDPFFFGAVGGQRCVMCRTVVREATVGGSLQRRRAVVSWFDL